MGLLERLFGTAPRSKPSGPIERDGHVHAPDADPDDVVLPKEKKSSRSLIGGKPPMGWDRQASKAWSNLGDSQGGHDSGGGGGGGGGGGDGGGGGA